MSKSETQTEEISLQRRAEAAEAEVASLMAQAQAFAELHRAEKLELQRAIDQEKRQTEWARAEVAQLQSIIVHGAPTVPHGPVGGMIADLVEIATSRSRAEAEEARAQLAAAKTEIHRLKCQLGQPSSMERQRDFLLRALMDHLRTRIPNGSAMVAVDRDSPPIVLKLELEEPPDSDRVNYPCVLEINGTPYRDADDGVAIRFPSVVHALREYAGVLEANLALRQARQAEWIAPKAKG